MKFSVSRPVLVRSQSPLLRFDEASGAYMEYAEPGETVPLPRGDYTGRVLVLKPWRVKNPLPRSEKVGQVPMHYSVSAASTSAKAITHAKTGRIWVDPEFWAGLTDAGRAFVIAHEVAHSKYRSEEKCDVAAACAMRAMGWRKRAIYAAQLSVLSMREESLDRFEAVFEKLKNYG